jgi:dTDP-4-amino-4,6-dideoxygalactose transaminase
MIPFFDYRPHYETLRGEIDEAMRRVIDSGRLILGPEVEAFENEFAAFVGSAGAVGVNSGTDALILAQRALEVGPGDEVLTVANAGVPPVAAIRAVGALPRFIDVSPASLLLDPEQLEQARTERTRCVIPVHLYGRPAPMTQILEFASRHDLAVIEDCAQAHGARIDERHVGTFGSIGCFSFYPTKNLGAFGDGGAVVSADPALLDRVRALRMYGFDKDRSAHHEGVNSRLDEIQAAILRVKLAHLDADLATRRHLAEAYTIGLRDTSMLLPAPAKGIVHAVHLFVLSTPERERLIRALESHQIGYGVHYPEPVHRMPAYDFLGYPEGRLPASEAACHQVLSLPLYVGLGREEVESVVQAVLSVT